MQLNAFEVRSIFEMSTLYKITEVNLYKRNYMWRLLKHDKVVSSLLLLSHLRQGDFL
mgnify:FL=1